MNDVNSMMDEGNVHLDGSKKKPDQSICRAFSLNRTIHRLDESSILNSHATQPYFLRNPETLQNNPGLRLRWRFWE